jgi:hypothetical protein
MPRAKKTRESQQPDEAGAKDASADASAPVEDSDAAARPSQLDKIRAALSEPAEPAELPEPVEAPELPAPAEMEELPPPAVEASGEAGTVEETPASAVEETAGSAPEEPEPPAPEETPPPPAVAVEPVASPWVPPPAYAPAAAQRPAASSRASSTLALGIVLVVVGFFFLVVRLANVDLSTYGWPLYVIIPGLTLVVVGVVSLGTGAIIPGSIVTMAGLVLAYQNSTGDWASWAYAWALVAPGGVGIGIFLQGLRDRDAKSLRRGRSLMFWSVLIFMIGFVLFESILDISGVDYGIVGRAALPALLIVIGVTLLARSVRRGRSA